MRHELELQWQKSRDGWIPFDRLSMQSKALNDVHGIYILWSGDEIVKIGKGRIRDGLVKDKTNRKITEIEGLMVTWAAIDLSKIDNVLRFLIEKLKPKIVDAPNLKVLGYGHERVVHSNFQWKKGDCHTNNIEGYWSNLKKSIFGTHTYVSPKHLQNYLNEFDFRHNNRKERIFDKMLCKL